MLQVTIIQYNKRLHGYIEQLDNYFRHLVTMLVPQPMPVKPALQRQPLSMHVPRPEQLLAHFRAAFAAAVAVVLAATEPMDTIDFARVLQTMR